MSLPFILAKFPNLQPGFDITSPQAPYYNCIGWAANDDTNFWWPGPNGYWPESHNSVASVNTFENAFRGLGYEMLNLDDSLDPAIEKVAIYVGANTGLVTHMARQLADGTWTSKLGKGWDIKHLTAHCLNGNEYGTYSHCVGRPR